MFLSCTWVWKCEFLGGTISWEKKSDKTTFQPGTLRLHLLAKSLSSCKTRVSHTQNCRAALVLTVDWDAKSKRNVDKNNTYFLPFRVPWCLWAVLCCSVQQRSVLRITVITSNDSQLGKRTFPVNNTHDSLWCLKFSLRSTFSVSGFPHFVINLNEWSWHSVS